MALRLAESLLLQVQLAKGLHLPLQAQLLVLPQTWSQEVLQDCWHPVWPQ